MRTRTFFIAVLWTITMAAVLVQSPVRAKALETGEEHLPAGIAVPGYGPGVAGNVSVGPTTPVCWPGLACTRPFAHAQIAILDRTAGRVLARTVTNRLGNFLVSVPTGEYVVRVRTPAGVLVCDDVKVTVVSSLFALVVVECDTGIR